MNFFVIPAPQITAKTFLAFQQAIISQGLDFNKTDLLPNQIALLRTSTSPFQISIGTPDRQIGQILIVAPELVTPISIFTKEAEAALRAFEEVWIGQNRQIIQSDATIRELYETTSQHAFQELWENRLGQSSQGLGTFGKPIRGGGLRFVMDPTEEDPVQAEIKIESYLQDTSKIFIETQFVWVKQSADFHVNEHLEAMNEFINQKVLKFISG